MFFRKRVTHGAYDKLEKVFEFEGLTVEFMKNLK